MVPSFCTELMNVSFSWLAKTNVSIRKSPWNTLTSLSSFSHKFSACFVRLTWIVWEMGGKWPNNCCFVKHCFQAVRKILVKFPSSFFYQRFIQVRSGFNYFVQWHMSLCGFSNLKSNIAQSAGTVEYIDFTSAEVVRRPNECPVYDTKQSDDEVPVMLWFWGMWSTPPLPLLPVPLCFGVVAPDRALSMG